MNYESNWEECLESNASISVSVNGEKAKSLIDTAEGRNIFLDENEIKEQNANYIFEGYYTSILELSHAIMLRKGFKIMNHICLGYYFRDVLNREDIYRLFDDCRFKRNSLIYYGRKMDYETAQEAILKCKKLITELKRLL